MNTSKIIIAIPPTLAADHAEAVRAYITRLEGFGFPAILSIEHLSLLIGVSSETLLAMSNSPINFYRTFDVRKANGGKRKICAPLPTLLLVQRWILENVLEKSQVHAAAKAYKKKSSIKVNARLHRKQNCLFKSDVVDFFGSISEYNIIKIFLGFGYIKNVAVFLGKICCLDKSLPQGAATSGYLSNLFMKAFDETLLKQCSDRSLRYSRYADDIAISGSEITFDELYDLVEHELGQVKLRINKAKTKLRLAHHRQKVAGVVVNVNLSVDRDYLRKLRQDCYYIEKFGIFGHTRQTGAKSPRYCIESLIGRLSHAIFISPKNTFLLGKKQLMIELRRQTFGS